MGVNTLFLIAGVPNSGAFCIIYQGLGMVLKCKVPVYTRTTFGIKGTISALYYITENKSCTLHKVTYENYPFHKEISQFVVELHCKRV